MTIGARDHIDRLLVQKYAQEKVDNHDADALDSRVPVEDMYQSMNASANSFRTMLELKNKLTLACYSINAMSAKYRQSDCA